MIWRLTLGYLGVIGAVLVGTMAYLLIAGQPVRVFTGPAWFGGLGVRVALLVGTLAVAGVTVWAAATTPADDVPARWSLPPGAAAGTLGILLVLIGGLTPTTAEADLRLAQMIITCFGMLAVAYVVAALTRRSSAAVMAAVWYYLLASLGGIAGEVVRGLLVGSRVMRPGAVALQRSCDGQAAGAANTSCVLGSVLAGFGTYLSFMILMLVLAVPVAAAGRNAKVFRPGARGLQVQALRTATVTRVCAAAGVYAVALLLLTVASY